MKAFTIHIANTFSLIPSGRYAKDGDSNATIFFQIVKHFLELHKNVIIDFNDCLSVGSSFLDEFVKLICKNNMSDKITIKADCDFIVDRYDRYMTEHY